mmetsp:Transcript_34/g.134  ORF Transcript_34/g.134 Transcript_34/m.134 type:complete len:259 (+) Transcript_34:1677-2453(+)
MGRARSWMTRLRLKRLFGALPALLSLSDDLSTAHRQAHFIGWRLQHDTEGCRFVYRMVPLAATRRPSSMRSRRALRRRWPTQSFMRLRLKAATATLRLGASAAMSAAFAVQGLGPRVSLKGLKRSRHTESPFRRSNSSRRLLSFGSPASLMRLCESSSTATTSLPSSSGRAAEHGQVQWASLSTLYATLSGVPGGVRGSSTSRASTTSSPTPCHGATRRPPLLSCGAWATSLGPSRLPTSSSPGLRVSPTRRAGDFGL